MLRISLCERRSTSASCFAARLVSLLLVLLPTTTVLAQAGDLLVLPTRVVLEGQKRNEVLTLINRGADTATFSLSFIQYKMTEQGELKIIEQPEEGQRFAHTYLRFYPKQVTLAPGEGQNVRVQVVRRDTMPDGEYRSHLYIRAHQRGGNDFLQLIDTSSKAMTVRLIPVFGVSIPIFIRKGNLTAKGALTQPALAHRDTARMIALNIVRDGSRSLYGHLRVFLRNEGRSDELIGEIKGIAVYAPLCSRRVHIPLSIPRSRALESANLRIVYTERPQDGGRVISTVDFQVPQLITTSAPER